MEENDNKNRLSQVDSDPLLQQRGSGNEDIESIGK